MIRIILKLIGFLLVVGLFGFLALGPEIADRMQNPVTKHDPWPVTPAAQAMHERLIIGDMHADTLLWDRDLTKRQTRGHVDLPRLAEGNVALQVFTTVTKSPSGLNYEENAAEARDDITLLYIGQLRPFRAWLDLTERALEQARQLAIAEEKAPEMLKIIRSRADLTEVLRRRSEGEQVVGGILGAEGGHALGDDQTNLGKLYDAGFRLIGLTHFFDNEIGGSLHGEAGAEAGLTRFGRSVVEEMIRRHMIIDLAHASPQTARDVLDMTDMPVVVSHTGIRSHCETVRNFPDDLMRAIAAEGGLIGIGFWADVTCDDTPAGIAGAIIAAIGVVGEDHVALGSDFDGAVRTTFDASELAALTQALIDRGLPEDVIAKVMGGNMVRFLQAALPEE
ncbi:membrane dipeptidase [Defluviimonas sp. WL0050]|uniref:Membrane dipeptidase n=1 Tax=Albidovulum litorale TaxID=2984134 RepID=A0ABT2ZKQ6_9RHOB|nr:membrane dipeptidase [Defluviimonas sp. WL0050]MCV2871321.1 membrane dipeptidase [Defluviimonas sp. WL0050]